MGGLVVKQSCLLAYREPEFKLVADRVCSIFFLATPHQGAAIAQVLSRLTAVIGTRPFVEDLFPQSPLIQSLSEDFPQISGHLQLLSFYETRPMSVGLSKTLIVEKSSAVLNLPNERRTFLEADHRHVAMYSTQEDPSYASVKNALATVIASQRDLQPSQSQTPVGATTQSPSEQDRDTLSQFLGVFAAPEDDLMTQESRKLTSSCDWLISRECYQSWKASTDPAFLWLQGRPGAGKSVLSGHIVNDLRAEALDCSFFFFQERDSTKSTAASCLLSMAWQMAMLHPGILEKMKRIISEWRDKNMDKIGSHSVWQRIFLSGILTVKLDRPQFWVIDAMDECVSPGDMTVFLTRIQEHWPLSAIVTSRDSMESFRHGTSHKINMRSYTISEHDALHGISLLLQDNLPYLPCLPSSGKWPTPEKLASEILENSTGSFLWASLICSELRQVTSEAEIAEVMASTPSDMDALYCDILSKMERARFGRETAKAILAWATFSFRPLHVFEMQQAIELDMNDKINDVRRVISKNCGSLLFVDKYEKIQLVHLTAREFLTREKLKSDIVLTKPDGHRQLAVVCLQSLLDTSKGLSDRLENASKVPQPAQSTTSTLLDYASKFLFQHLDQADSNDEELLLMLSKFFGSRSVLYWIELIATSGDLRTVSEAGKTIKSILIRRARHPPSPTPGSHGLVFTPRKLDLLERWGDDLTRLVLQFSEKLRGSPKTIHHHIAPFCPLDSAIRQTFGSPVRGLMSVQGLSSRNWNKCLTTIRDVSRARTSSVATSPGYIAISVGGRILFHDDAIFQELHTLYHGEPVRGMAFSKSGRYFASVGTETARIWFPSNGLELVSFKMPAIRGLSSWDILLRVAFVERDTGAVLRILTSKRRLVQVEWDIESGVFVHHVPPPWPPNKPEAMQGEPDLLERAWLSPATNLVAVMYRDHGLAFWDCTEKRIYDACEQNTGSLQLLGSDLQDEDGVSDYAGVFNHTADNNLFAVIFRNGCLAVFDIDAGVTLAVNSDQGRYSHLASSHDGQTLAAVDDLGNLALFEFKTLQLLSRMHLGTNSGLTVEIVFTADDRRVVETCEGHCSVWELPSFCTDSSITSEEDVSFAKHEPVYQEDLTFGHKTRREKEIASITCSHESGMVFYALKNGSVFGSDISGTEPGELLFDLPSEFFVFMLYFED